MNPPPDSSTLDRSEIEEENPWSTGLRAELQEAG